MDNNSLTHWGVRGMRWGIRRYQNKDGSLTPAGRKRYNAEMEALKKEEQILKRRKSTQAKFDRLEAKRKAIEEQKNELDGKNKPKKSNDESAKTNKTPAKKSVKDMSDEELMSAIRRTQLEQQYSNLTAKPETTDKGNSFVKDFMTKSVVPAVQEAGRSLIKDSLLKAGKKYLGLEESATGDTLDALEKKVKRLDLEKRLRRHEEEAAEARERASTDSDSSRRTSTDSDSSRRTSTDSDSSRRTFTDRVTDASRRMSESTRDMMRRMMGRPTTTYVTDPDRSRTDITPYVTVIDRGVYSKSMDSARKSPSTTRGSKWTSDIVESGPLDIITTSNVYSGQGYLEPYRNS